MTTVGERVQLIDIKKELSLLWDQEIGQNRTRACLFNLIIYTESTDRTPFYEDLIKKVIGKFPCRIFWILEDTQPNAEYLRTSVSSETIGEGASQLFCEQIKIETAGNVRNRVPYILLPHLLPDLPVYVLWTQDPMRDQIILPFFEPIADRIIFDPEEASDLQAFSQTILELLKQCHSTISDLNWVATRGWREIFRNVFNSPEALQILLESKSIHITYNQNPTAYSKFNEIKAAYFQAWLAAQLKWNFKTFEKEKENICISYKAASSEPVIRLIPSQQQDLPPGALLSIEIESKLHKAHYIFKRVPGSRQLLIQFSDNTHCDLPYCLYLGGLKSGHELIEEIFYETTGGHYKNMLLTLSQIPWKH